MNEGFAVRGAVCSVSPPRQSAVSRAALAVGVVLALSLALLFGFTPKAWADSDDRNYELVYMSSQKATISWILDVYKSQDNDGVYSVNQTMDGMSRSWQYKQDKSGSMDLQSGNVDANGNTVPSLYYWPTFYKPFSLYVDGVKVAWSDLGGEIDGITVQWDGMMDFRSDSGETDSESVYGNLDLRVIGHGKDSASTQDYYRPMGTSEKLGDSWNLHPGALEQGTTGMHDGGTHTIELVLYERVELPTFPETIFPGESALKDAPEISLKYEDGTEYEGGSWTNKNVFVEATPVAGDYTDKFYVVLFRDNGCIEVARTGLATLPFDGNLKARYVVRESTSMEGEMYFGSLFNEKNWPMSPKSTPKFVRVDKQKPTISGISISGGTPVVSASDALSGVALIEGRKSASEEWSPIYDISLSDDTKYLYVRVTDNAGNSETRMMYIPGDSGSDTPSDGGDDPSGRGDGFKMQRAV